MQTRTEVCPSPRQPDDIITEHISYLYLLSDVLSMCWPMPEKIKGITVFWRNGKIETWLLSREIIRLFEDELPYMSDPNTLKGTAELFPGTWLKRLDFCAFKLFKKLDDVCSLCSYHFPIDGLVVSVTVGLEADSRTHVCALGNELWPRHISRSFSWGRLCPLTRAVTGPGSREALW